MFLELSPLESFINKVLTKDYPLSSRSILQKVEKQHGIKYSPAGIQKALLSLVQKGVLHKHSKYYQLKTDTLLDEKKHIQSILDRYIAAGSYQIFQKKETTYYFETLSELDYFWNATVEKWFNFYPEKKYAYRQKQPFPWFAVMHLDEERRVVANICKKCKAFQTLCADNPMTRRLKPVYTEHPNSTYHLVQNMKHINHAFGVFGDHVIETFHPKSITDVMKKICFSETESILFSSIIELSKRGSYKLSIHKDKKKATQYYKMIGNL